MSERIVRNPKVMLGKPVVAGTRITVELILERLGTGESIDQFLAGFPHVTREDVLAALAYAAGVLRNDEIHVTGDPAA